MKSIFQYIGILIITGGFLLSGCEEFLDRNPLDEVSEATFWKTEDDARLALNGVYERDGEWRDAYEIAHGDCWSDNGLQAKADVRDPIVGTDFTPSTGMVAGHWNGSYDQIAKCNTFLENIDKVDMDEDLKNEYIAEVRFFRAWEYFNLTQWFEDVPLVKKVLTMDEANSVTVTPKSEIVEFVLNELDAVIPELPATRPDNEHGRILRGAAYAVKGRLLMSEERWSEAATAYKNLMDMNVHSIDEDYRSLFDGSNEQSSEIIFVSKYLKAEVTHNLQLTVRPNLDGGWHHSNPSKDLVDSYLCANGETIEENATYQNADDFKGEFVNDQGEWYRDPRLYYTIYLPDVHVLQGGLVYQGHPDSTQSGDQVGEDVGTTGYGLRKWVDENYEGDIWNSGNDAPIIRYAEVLLSYLESKIKAGDPISQDLLDNTINQIRTRESVDMPPVNRSDYGSAMDLWNNCVKRERRIELAYEGKRLWDLVRWGEDGTLTDKVVYGIKLTENPETYEGEFSIDDEGYARIFTMKYQDHYHPWPIPQDELDINSNLEQKDNWK